MTAGPQHREIGFPISTDNASWRGPHREIGTPISTDNASWGGPQHKEILFLSKKLVFLMGVGHKSMFYA
ncbi:hypothetical protein ACVPOR_01545 [Staphylococcus aureus]